MIDRKNLLSRKGCIRIVARQVCVPCFHVGYYLGILLFAAEPAVPAEQYQLQFSTYLGGSGGENFRDVAVDAAGNVYVTGGTSSTDFPTTPGAYDRTFASGGSDLGTAGPMDVFVTKLSPGGQLVWSTYLGGPNYDRAYAIEVDHDGCVYVAGRAGPGFSTTAGVIQPSFGGDTVSGASAAYGKQDGFIAKIAPDGSQLIWSSYFGDDGAGFIRDMDIDSLGDVYVVSPGNPYANHPHVTAGCYDAIHNGADDVVVAKVSADGTQVMWGTYLGGSANDGGGPSIRVDPQTGEVVVVGNTSSSNFPTPNGYDTTYNGTDPVTGDAFLAKFTADGSALEFATYLGGSSEEGTGTHNLALGPGSEIFAAHWTKSADIRILKGGFRTTHSGGITDCIVWKFSAGGQILANTYLGGNGDENVQGTVVDAEGNLYLSIDSCTSTNFPVTTGAYQTANRGVADAVFVKLNADLSRMLYATYLGGSGSDGSREAALASEGSFIFAGDTASTDFPLRNAYDVTLNGSGDGFVARFSPLAPPAITTFGVGSHKTLTLTWTGFATAYTVEFAPDLLRTPWEPVSPGDQWPIQTTFWTGPHVTGDTTLFYRIRGE